MGESPDKLTDPIVRRPKTAFFFLQSMERNPQFANCLQINGNLLDTQKDTKKTRLEAGRERKRAGENPKSGPLANAEGMLHT